MARPNQIVANIGLYHVGFKLSERGWNVMTTSRNARGVDVICFDMDGKRQLSIQVKSLSKRNAVPLGKDKSKIVGDFWIVVSEIASGAPRTYILLPHEVRALARASGKREKSYWLQPSDYAVSAFEERWEQVS